MNDKLRENPDNLEALVGVTAEALGMPAVYVEKDFWVTEVLRAASVDRSVVMPSGSTAPVAFTFKGGASLSRVFGIVERFSEDVDLLAVFPPGATAGARHKVKRYTTYLYPTGSSDPSLKDSVELGCRGSTQPSAVHAYRSLVAEHAITVLGESESTWEEFAEFSVNVLAPERTLFER